MDEILIACGDVDRLKRIIADLPEDEFKPIATKTGRGILGKVRDRDVRVAVVHLGLEDEYGLELCRELRQLDPPLNVLLLTENPPDEGPFDRALSYPVPGPVFRNALDGVIPEEEQEELEREKWQAFYSELQSRVDDLSHQNYYEMLGLTEEADHHQIVEAFDRLSRRYHPDRYSQYRDRNWGRRLHASLGELYTALTEAFEVLSDRKLRKRYDALRDEGRRRMPPDELSSQQEGPESLPEIAESTQAKQFLEMAQTEIANENWDDAVQNLEFARSVEPDNDRIAEKLREIEQKSK